MIKKGKKAKFEPHKHLEHWVKKTTYADRLKWLEEANAFVRLLQKKKNYPNLPKKGS